MNHKPYVRFFVPNRGLVPSAPFPPARYHVEREPGTTTYTAYPLPDEDKDKKTSTG
jgi:hypothetical protein